MAKNIKEALQSIINCFESGKIPQAIAYSVFPTPNVPSSSWSLLNRTLVFLSGTSDARGFRQWKAAKRHVKKGAKALYILVPRIVERENNKGDDEKVLAGFMARAVFRVEDTEGEPLSYEQIKLPDLQLMEKAREWGISVKAIPGNYSYYGYFSQDRKEIALATKDESIFFHELSHYAHHRLIGDLKKAETWRKEIVAELASAVLCNMVGKTSKYLGNNFQYVRHYARKANLSPVNACLKVMTEVEKVLGLILTADKEDDRISPQQAGCLGEISS